jgi:hypothetical protein
MSTARLPRHRRCHPVWSATSARLAVCSILLWGCGVACGAVWAQTPPTPLEASDDGQQLRVPGEPRPPQRLILPLLRTGRIAADRAVQRPEVAVTLPPAASETAATPPRRPPVGPVIEAALGYTWVPRGMFAAFSGLSSGGRRDQHPYLQGLAVDGGYRRPLGDDAWLVWRGGITIPLVPAQNWWSSSGSPAPVYTEIQLAVLEGGADYLRRVALGPKLQWTLRGGLGLMVLAGSVDRIETLPNCTAAQAASCPHWRIVGRLGSGVPPVLPVVRALTGLDVQIAPGWTLAIEAGLRSVPFVGLTVGHQL